MKISRRKAAKISKHGINLSAYPINRKEVGLVRVKVKAGHFEEFYHKKSTFLYYVIKGKGNFYLNSKKVPVKIGDVIVAPPRTNIYYLGAMELILVTTPAWEEKDEVHVRFVPRK